MTSPNGIVRRGPGRPRSRDPRTLSVRLQLNRREAELLNAARTRFGHELRLAEYLREALVEHLASDLEEVEKLEELGR